MYPLNVRLFRCRFLNQFFQSGPLVIILDPLGDTHMTDARHEHQVAGGDGKLGREPGAFGADGVFGDLDDQGLAFT